MRPFKYSMEYGVKDSTVSEGERQSISLNDQTIASVAGIPRNYLDLTTVTRFGPRFVAWLMARQNQTVPTILRDLTGNFPLFLPEISETEPTLQSIDYWQTIDRSAVSSTKSSLNGRSIECTTLDIFTLVDGISSEQSFLAFLCRSAGDVPARLRIRAHHLHQ
jgi:UDP-glucose:glycoprotein glucosyltransferase